MSTAVPISVVIPAHNEEDVLGRCLNAALQDSRPGELEVVVVCNGCTDRTAEIARGYGDRVSVIETPKPSKTSALNLGDTLVRGFPRFYVDADVMLPVASIRRIATRLADGDTLAASPVMDLDLRGSSLAVRAYYRVWRRLPYVREGMIGVGVYALSEEGRGRFGEFPDVIADDGYVRMLFSPAERTRVDAAPVCVYAPGQLSELVRIKTRSLLGRYQLGSASPISSRANGRRSRTAVRRGRSSFDRGCGPQRSVYVAVHRPDSPSRSMSSSRRSATTSGSEIGHHAETTANDLLPAAEVLRFLSWPGGRPWVPPPARQFVHPPPTPLSV